MKIYYWSLRQFYFCSISPEVACGVLKPTSQASLNTGDLDLPFVPGSIHNPEVREFWTNTLECAPWVTNVLQFGYSIPFDNLPQPYEERNNASVRTNMAVVVSIVENLAELGVIKFVDVKPTCVNPLGLVTKTVAGQVSHRLVLDVSRWVNRFTSPSTVRLAHLEKALEITEARDFQTVFDLKSAYHHVKIVPEQVQYLGASIQIGSTTKYFVFTHLPFGLNCAVHAITKLWKPLVAYIHKQGIRFSIYIDDGRILSRTASAAEADRVFVYNTIKAAGWQIAWHKSDKCNDSNVVKKYLGFVIDTSSMKVVCPQDKWDELRLCIVDSLSHQSVEVKILSRILGRIAALRPSHGRSVRICTRSGYTLLDKHVQLKGWTGHVEWSLESRKELTFFILHANKFNGAPMSHSLSAVSIRPIQEFVSDASGFKAAVKWLEGSNAGTVAVFPFDIRETQLSSGERELLAMHRLFRTASFEHQFQHTNILWLTDSTNVVAFVTKGSPKPSIQEKVFDIFTTLTALHCTIDPIHLSRTDERIQQVDHLSKVLDTDNWSVDEATFQIFNSQFQFEVDLFADNCNRKVVQFASKFYHDQAIAVDAFSIAWSKMAWVCPPTSLIIRVVQRIRNSRCEGLLIIPNWPASSFFPLIFAKGKVLHPFRLISEFSPYILQNEGARNTPLFGKTNFTFFALYFNTITVG